MFSEGYECTLHEKQLQHQELYLDDCPARPLDALQPQKGVNASLEDAAAAGPQQCPGTVVPLGLNAPLRLLSLELRLRKQFVLCPTPSVPADPGEEERGGKGKWKRSMLAIQLKGSEQPTTLQCCLCIFLVAGVSSKTSGENSLNRTYTVLSQQESNLWTKSRKLHKRAEFGIAALQIPTADVLKQEITCSTAQKAGSRPSHTTVSAKTK